MICPGPCNNRHRAVSAERMHLAVALGLTEDTPPDDPRWAELPDLPDAVEGRPTWCMGCSDTIRDAVDEIPGLCARLAGVPDGRVERAPDDGDKTRRVTRTGSPSPSPAWDRVDEAARWIVEKADAVREVMGHGPRTITVLMPDGTQTQAVATRRMVKAEALYLRRHWTVVMAQEWAEQMMGALLLRHTLKVAVGEGEAERRIPGPDGTCRVCGLRALVEVQRIWGPRIECRSCGGRRVA